MMREGAVFSLSVHTPGEEVPTLGMGGVVLTCMGEGVATLDGGRGYLPWMGKGYLCLMGRGTYLGWGKGYLPWIWGRGYQLKRDGPTLDGGGGTFIGWGKGYPPWMGGGVPTLDRLCRRGYASCSFPQEDFLVF